MMTVTEKNIFEENLWREESEEGYIERINKEVYNISKIEKRQSNNVEEVEAARTAGKNDG